MQLFSFQPVFKAEARSSIRINERFPVTWHFKDRDVDGMAKVRNLSTTGMMVETNANVDLPQNGILSFDLPQVGQMDFLPPLGRIAWSRKEGTLSPHMLMGIEFVNPGQEILFRLTEKIKSKVAEIESFEKIKNQVGIALFVIMGALLAFYIVQQAIFHRNIEQTNQILIVNANEQADLYSGILAQNQEQQRTIVQMRDDLSLARTHLALAEETLAQSNLLNQQLANEIDALKVRNLSLFEELAGVRERLRIFEGNVANMDEAKSSLRLNRSVLKRIRGKINDLKNEASLARAAAQKELDRIALANGNQGYVIRGTSSPHAPSAGIPKKVNINVSIVE